MRDGSQPRRATAWYLPNLPDDDRVGKADTRPLWTRRRRYQVEEENHAKDDRPERDEERRPIRMTRSERAAVVLGLLIQVVALVGELSDLFR